VREVVNLDLWKSQRGAASSVLGLSGFLNHRPLHDDRCTVDRRLS
jgi:hypothetical protein